ncbi:hypothetical protein GJM53_RS19805 [Escherichia coli]|nr:hypothetical protein [Escherichia coli]EEQ8120660.1 hypothetical protein [Escherichia coli]
MFFMPVDLFTPFIEGREKAIDRNWNDLNQANQVERGWLDNDAKQLSNWFKQDSYLDRLQQIRNQTDVSNMNRDLMAAGQGGNLAQAGMYSDIYTDFASKLGPNIDTVTRNMLDSVLGNAEERGAYGRALSKYAGAMHNINAKNALTAAQNKGDLLPLERDASRNLLTNQLQNGGYGIGGMTTVPGGTGSVFSWDGNSTFKPTESSVMPERTNPPSQQNGLLAWNDIFDVMRNTAGRAFMPGVNLMRGF